MSIINTKIGLEDIIPNRAFLLRFGGISGEFGSYFSETVEPKDR